MNKNKIKHVSGELARYTFSAGTAAIIDLGLFALLGMLLKPSLGVIYAIPAVVLARIVSSTYNGYVNYKLVFRSDASFRGSMAKFYCLVAIQMVNSAILTTLGIYLFPELPDVLTKFIVDSLLFVINYVIQRKLVFTRR